MIYSAAIARNIEKSCSFHVQRPCECRVLVAGMFLFTLLACSTISAQTSPPAPFSLTPTTKQVEWFHREQQAFIHFNMNTFTNKEWGSGTETPATFNPTGLDCNQWCRVFKSAGITTAILVIKHHDGFCLWPTRYTEHCVRNATWRNGKGDVLKEFTDACRASGIKAAIYLSPWDMHEEQPGALHPMGTQAYITYYCNQIVELCKNKPYGPLYEIWQDGAGNINAISETDYKKWTDTLRAYMPECVVWATKKSAGVGDVRWVCNEDGVAGDPCWSTVRTSDVLAETGNNGSPDGDRYMPAETNVSIRPGWFYHANEHPKTVQQLWDMYFTSTARNTVWLLNFTPDTRGLIPAEDSVNAAELGKWIYGTFRANLLSGAAATALHTRGPGFDPALMLDNCEDTYFALGDSNATDTITFTPVSSVTFDCIMLQEVIALGHRSLNWSVDAYYNNAWATISGANNKQCVGFKRAVKFSPAVTATQVRLRITKGRACPAIHTFGVYKQTQAAPPENWDGLTPVEPSCATGIGTEPLIPADSRMGGLMRIAGGHLVLPADFGAGALNILDVQGRRVAGMAVHGQHIDLPSLTPGYYIVNYSGGGRTVNSFFIIGH
jgi:alpha-L-fucosidase